MNRVIRKMRNKRDKAIHSFKAALILLGTLVSEPPMAEMSECLCTHGRTEGLIVMLHVTL